MKYIPVKPHGITNALAIYGTDLPGVRGKQVRNQPPRVETGTENIHNYFYQLQHFFTLTADVMFVNGVEFLITLSSKTIPVDAEHIPAQMA